MKFLLLCTVFILSAATVSAQQTGGPSYPVMSLQARVCISPAIVVGTIGDIQPDQYTLTLEYKPHKTVTQFDIVELKSMEFLKTFKSPDLSDKDLFRRKQNDFAFNQHDPGNATRNYSTGTSGIWIVASFRDPYEGFFFLFPLPEKQSLNETPLPVSEKDTILKMIANCKNMHD